jgi:CRISPR system Cascade subunit CasE
MSAILSLVDYISQDRAGYRLARNLDDPYRQHQELWKLFQAEPGTEQPFLFRAMPNPVSGQRRFMLLSEQAPIPRPDWNVRSKVFQPALTIGQQLGFSIRLNPTRSVRPPSTSGERVRGSRQDLIMASLHSVPRSDRAAARARLVHEELPNWFARLAVRHGFKVSRASAPLDDDDGFSFAEAGGSRLLCSVERYEVLRTEVLRQRAGGTERQHVTLGSADISGKLEIIDPDAFRRALLNGIGHGRAFGLGLMLVQRVA